ncbi:MAG: nuclear transport factor 2 family protein [Pseudomonadota bacterium]|nr:nuclear transport factor 2 family protein [Pseudomonadota bacterium]
MKTRLIAGLMVLLSSATHAQDAPTTGNEDPAAMTAEALARDYMVHYSAADWDGMEAYLADDVVFSDPTALGDDVGPDGYQYDSRAAIMAALRAFDARYNPIELGFEWDTVFESNDRVVFMGHVNARYPTEDPDRHFRWRAEQVTVITVRDGQIVRQDDFANYAAPETGLVPAQ